jgi:hypothetical protein
MWNLLRKIRRNKKMDNFQTEIDLEQLDSELKYFVYKWTKGENSGTVCEYDKVFKEPTTGTIWINFKDGSRINYILLDEFMLRLEPSQLQQNKALPASPVYNTPTSPGRNVMLSEETRSIQYTESNPIVSLLEKQKPNWIEVGIKLKLNLPTKSLYSVLSGSFDDAEEEIIEFVVKDLDIELVKQSLRNQIKEIYRGDGTIRKTRGNISTQEEEY